MSRIKLIPILGIVFGFLSLELQIASESHVLPAWDVVSFLGNASAAEPMGLTVRRSNISAKNNSNFFEFFITGGYRPEDKSLLKYLVSLRTIDETKFFGDNHFCGGSIISKRIILTAAHCLYNGVGLIHRPGKLRVIAGTPKRLQRANTTQVIHVNRVKPHARYNSIHIFNDIGILELKEDINIDGQSAAIIEMTDEEPAADTACTVIGWGTLLQNGPMPDEAVFGNMDIKSRDDCKQYRNLHPSTICAQNPKDFETDSCQGDSGGPMICNEKLVGIVSFGFGCGRPDEVGYYSNVYYHRDWIKMNRASARSHWPFHSSAFPIVLHILYLHMIFI